MTDHDMPNTVADAKIALYAAMRRGTDPRWGAEPVEPIKPRSKLWLLFWLFIGLIAAGVIASI